jgi:glycosyltransferase involved in cell wall biosynthesis
VSIPETAERRFHVAHLTSVHQRYDIRIFRKQCRSLAKAGFEVSLVVADGKGDEVTEEGIRIYDVGRMQGRLNRIFRTTRRVYARARALNADLYQFHDPELFPTGLKLRRQKKVVIFDSHEDVPKQMLGKPYLNAPLLKLIAWIFAGYETWAVRRISAVIGATPHITEKFSAMSVRAVNVNNFPQIGELENALPWSDKADEICYVGGIAEIRGIIPLVTGLDVTSSNARLNLVGEFSEAETEKTTTALSGWRLVNSHGFLDRRGVRDVLARSVAGVVTFAPLPNHIDAQPNKMFEYMSAGIPVIASDFPLWREIILGSKCGICVDPGDPTAIATAIDTLVGDKKLAEQLGQNGKHAVHETYNWQREEPKLIELYQELLE